MNKKILKKLLITLLLTLMFSTLSITSNVNAMNTISNKKQKITKDMTFNSVGAEESIIEDQEIMEYDASTGITKKVDMKQLKKSVTSKNIRNGELSDRIEPYDPLANTISNKNISPRAVYNPVTNISTFPYRAICRIKADVYGKELVASGYMASAKVLVTAAHCVMNVDDKDNFFTEWVAYPGYNNGSSYNGISSGWAKIYYSNKWKTTHSIEHDLCLCIVFRFRKYNWMAWKPKIWYKFRYEWSFRKAFGLSYNNGRWRNTSIYARFNIKYL